MNDTAIAYIRTYVPILVGSVIAWVAARTGFVVDEQTQAGFVLAFGGLVSGIYYALVNVLSKKWPVLGMFLGVAKTPTY